MWMHIDSSNYGEAKVGVATSDSICGSYKYVRSFQPLGRQSRDMGLFKDDDGSGYLLSEDVRSNRLLDILEGLMGLRISEQAVYESSSSRMISRTLPQIRTCSLLTMRRLP
jgi:hypothetical protein